MGKLKSFPILSICSSKNIEVKNLILLIITALASISLYGQKYDGLVLEYDLYTNQITYLKNGILIDKPSVKEGENIYVVLTEYNPYVMQAELVVEQTNYNQKDLNSYTGEYGGHSSQGLSGISGLLGGLDLGFGLSDAFAQIPGARGGADAKVLAAKSEFNMLTDQLSSIERKINLNSKKLSLFQTTAQSRSIAIADIDALKSNRQLRPSKIKSLIEEEIRYAFAKVEGEDIKLDDLINETSKKNEIQESIDNYNDAQSEYRDFANRWVAFSAKIELLSDGGIDDQFTYIKSSSDSVLNVINNTLSLAESVEMQPSDLNQYFEGSASTLAALRRTYEELQGDLFTFRFPPFQAQNDKVELTIQVLKKDIQSGYTPFKTMEQVVPVTGGWKISGGLGLAFASTFNQTYEYEVVNDAIVASELDDFVPSVVSFAHIYKNTARTLQFGGSFGIGFPLQGGGFESLAFFAGPTMHLGKNQKFLLTAGIMGSKVNRLASGFEVGDQFISFTNSVPVVKKYEFGYFVGISYDLIK